MSATDTLCSVLIVDDHQDTADMLRRFLGRKRFPCDVANSAADAMERVRVKPPTCIVLDEWMPGMTGLAFLRELRGMPECQGVPVVFYSAAFDVRKQTEAETLGSSGWFVKGISRLDDLAARVAAVCGPVA